MEVSWAVLPKINGLRLFCFGLFVGCVLVCYGFVWWRLVYCFFYFVVVLFLIFSSLLCFAYFVLVCFLLTVFCNSFRLRQALSLSLN